MPGEMHVLEVFTSEGRPAVLYDVQPPVFNRSTGRSHGCVLARVEFDVSSRSNEPSVTFWVALWPSNEHGEVTEPRPLSLGKLDRHDIDFAAELHEAGYE